MKKYNKYIALLFVISAFFSCDSKLDIEPRQTLSTDVVLTNEENLEAVLFGAYAGLKGTFGTNEGGELFGGDFNLMSEMLAATDNVRWGGSFDTYREMANKDLTTTNLVVRDNWIRGYDVINSANNVLANLDLANTDAKRNLIEGQARAIRAMVYFDLVRIWSRPWGSGSESTDPGVPLVLQPTLTAVDADALKTLGRSTVSAVYSQILDDLTQAKSLISADLGANGTNISTYTVSAILSRVYLQQGNFALAAQEADRVISSEEYALAATPIGAFNNAANIGEDVFAIQQTSLSNAGTNNAGLTTFYARLFGNGRGDVQVQQAHLDEYEAGDLRGGLQNDLSGTATIGGVSSMFYLGVGGQNSGQIQCAKFGDPNLNIPVVRLAEMYLTRAEANFEEGTSVGDTPLNDINVIRERAGLAPLAGPITMDDIRKERRLELAFEGFRLHDFKRWQDPVGTLNYDAPELVMPIPEREIEVYDIPQNAGY
ncbi:RagB/SusD family nutrient uptake outer membrane protein [Fulvivirgaceae bacterium BMA10]|uniref:RagB/SusD family nutrient uptake outer membrane protein n=1 Tax=Splendidivirga corallicola TaxID=3051826 RepID=A0ABT8L042_9BACT|nr:RagB/SusD family nutrient uptake outer membrane protein [Fulvivirgaceae bacterium BMA10]